MVMIPLYSDGGRQLDWLLDKIGSEYEVKQSRIGPAPADGKAVRTLNRILQWTDHGLEWEADRRDSELIVRHCSLDERSKAVVTPGEKREFDDRESSPDLTYEEAHRFRAIVARGNYLAQDRSDVQFAVKELSRRMSASKECDWASAKRL